MKSRVRWFVLLVVVSVGLTGCFGNNAAAVRAAVGVGLDKFLSALEAQDAAQLEASIAAQLTIGYENDQQVLIVDTPSAADFVSEQVNGWADTITIELVVTGRQTTVSGDSAIVTGLVRMDYEEIASGHTFRQTANAEVTLVRSGSTWLVNGMQMTNTSKVQL